tara:strand:- start:344 stop:1057 length:714 start_codon:yes stop_codon:yes gene_type:complete
MRNFNRKHNEIRKVDITPGYNKFSDGSCLISFGLTKVVCNATIERKVPKWIKNSEHGWITAEYSMLPSSTKERMKRESKIGKQSGRTLEIERLIGRSLRSITNLSELQGIQIVIDCDVLQADGGTRTTSITGAYIAFCLAVKKLLNLKQIKKNPITDKVCAISCGLIKKKILVDLDFPEDSNAIADANFVFSEKQGIIEIQVSGEKKPISKDQFDSMYNLALIASKKIFKLQSKILE